jgi:hypothetical protein
MTLPAVAVTIGGVARDNNRVFNKLDGFYYTQGSNNKSGKLRSPVPINITINMSIITRFQSDMDQILSNFIPYTNPYVVISWPIPDEMGLPTEQEIRSEVLWDGSMAMTYPTDLNGQEKARVIADTTFVIKGWLFKEQTNPVGNIYYVKDNFYAQDFITTYENMSGDTYSFPLSTGLYSNEMETFIVSGAPVVTNMYWDSVLVEGNINLTPGLTGSVVLEGYNFNLMDGILLSSNSLSLFTSITAVSCLGTQKQEISGHLLNDYTIVNSNIVLFNMPPLYPNFRIPNVTLTIVPFNKAGYYTTSDLYE